MNKLYLPLLAIAFSTLSFAQTQWSVPEENVGLLTKTTATWCGPCGGWGWDAMGDLMANYGDDHIVISLYAPPSSKLHNAGAEALAEVVGGSGTPRFGGNGLNQDQTVSLATDIVDTFSSAAPVIANVAYEIERVFNDSITIKVKTKFFEDVEGKFETNVFLVENHVIEEQTGNDDSPNASHHNVHRGAFMEITDSTDVVTENGANKNDVFVKRYLFVIEPGWKLDEMFIASTLWMENPLAEGEMFYVNGTKEPQAGELVDGFGANGDPGDDGEWPIGIREFDNESAAVYPNPATEFFTVAQNGSGPISVELTDLLGKVVFTAQFTGNKNNVTVNDFPEGIYMIKVTNAEGTYLDRIVIK